MTIKELYEIVGGDYEKIIGNLKTDERVMRFLKMFIADSSFQELASAMEAKQYEDAFRAAHKLKGVCQNMFYTRMFQVVNEITEALRGQADVATAEKLLPDLEEIYELTIDTINRLD